MHRRTDPGETCAGEEVMPLRLGLVWRVLGEEMVTGDSPAWNVKRTVASPPWASSQPLRTRRHRSRDHVVSARRVASTRCGCIPPPALSGPGKDVFAADADDVVLGDLGPQLLPRTRRGARRRGRFPANPLPAPGCTDPAAAVPAASNAVVVPSRVLLGLRRVAWPERARADRYRSPWSAASARPRGASCARLCPMLFTVRCLRFLVPASPPAPRTSPRPIDRRRAAAIRCAYRRRGATGFHYLKICEKHRHIIRRAARRDEKTTPVCRCEPSSVTAVEFAGERKVGRAYSPYPHAVRRHHADRVHESGTGSGPRSDPRRRARRRSSRRARRGRMDDLRRQPLQPALFIASTRSTRTTSKDLKGAWVYHTNVYSQRHLV